jgi:ribosomal protein S18 acetylase RimI-like enzyme
MIEIVPAVGDESQAALALLFERLPAAQQQASIADVLMALHRGRVTLHGLLTARVKGVITGAILYVLQSDRTAFVWPPVASGTESIAETEDALMREVIRQIDLADAWIGQCLIDRHWRQERQTLERNGFAHLTDLRFLVRPLDETLCEPSAASPAAAEALETVAYQPGVNDSRFARLIEQTYRETHDCPELEGTRTGEQALASHRMSGDFDPSRWKLFRWGARDAGVLLMNNHPEQTAWEVVYLGVARDCRGNGLGRRMLTEGLSAARAAQRSAVLLAVDCRNDYAAKLYDDLGFVETDRKAVHLYFPPAARAAAARR